jgi:hypothetical protein
VPDAIVWLTSYGDNCLLACIAVAGALLNLDYVRHCQPGIPRALKAVAAIALAYTAILHALYVVGIFLGNGWFEAAALILAAVLALNAWVGRHRGACD